MRFKNSIKVSPLLYVYAKYLVNIMLYLYVHFSILMIKISACVTTIRLLL